MDTDYRPSQVQNAAVLLILLGILDIYLGYQSIQVSLIMRDSVQTLVGALMIAYGILTFCASLVVWLQKTWSVNIIAGVGITFCAALIIFGYYLIAIIVFAPLYWVGIYWIRKNRSTETPDWAPSWDED